MAEMVPMPESKQPLHQIMHQEQPSQSSSTNSTGSTPAKAKSVEISCEKDIPDFPPGWTKKAFKRTSGNSANHVDFYWYSPIENKKFRSMAETKRFLSALDECDGDENAAWGLMKSLAGCGSSQGSKNKKSDNESVGSSETKKANDLAQKSACDLFQKQNEKAIEEERKRRLSLKKIEEERLERLASQNVIKSTPPKTSSAEIKTSPPSASSSLSSSSKKSNPFKEALRQAMMEAAKKPQDEKTSTSVTKEGESAAETDKEETAEKTGDKANGSSIPSKNDTEGAELQKKDDAANNAKTPVAEKKESNQDTNNTNASDKAKQNTPPQAESEEEDDSSDDEKDVITSMEVSSFSKEQIAAMPVAFAYNLDDGGKSEKEALATQSRYYAALRKKITSANAAAAARKKKGTGKGTTKKAPPVRKKAPAAKHKAKTSKVSTNNKKTIRLPPKEISSGPCTDKTKFPNPGWTHKTFQRQGGATKGSSDTYWYSPKKKFKFRSMTEVKKFTDALNQAGDNEDEAWQKAHPGRKLPVTRVTAAPSVVVVKQEKDNEERAAPAKKQKKIMLV